MPSGFDALQQITGPLILQALEEKRRRAAEQRRVGELTQSFRSLGVMENKSAALSQLLASGQPLSGSMLEDFLAEGHMSEIKAGLPPGVNVAGLGPSQLKKLKEEYASYGIQQVAKQEQIAEYMDAFVKAKRQAKDGNLLDASVDPAVQTVGVFAASQLFQGMTGDILNKALTGKFTSEMEGRKWGGIPEEEILFVEDLIKAGYKSAKDIYDSGPKGQLAVFRAMTSLSLKDPDELTPFLSHGPTAKHILDLGYQAIQKQFQLLTGPFQTPADILRKAYVATKTVTVKQLRENGAKSEEISGMFERLGEPFPEDEDTEYSIPALLDENPVLYDFVIKNIGPDGNVHPAQSFEMGEDIYEILQREDAFKRLTPQRQEQMIKVVQDLARRPKRARDYDGWAQRLMNDYGWNEETVNLAFEYIDALDSGTIIKKFEPQFEQPSTDTTGGSEE